MNSQTDHLDTALAVGYCIECHPGAGGTATLRDKLNRNVAGD